MDSCNKDIRIKEIIDVAELQFENIGKLLSQLTDSKIEFSNNDFTRIINSSNSIFLAAVNRESTEEVYGILVLAIVDIPTGMVARIEDVVVDKFYRGKGIGETIILAAIQRAKDLGIKHIDLTSNPKRKAANRLYKKLGFQQRKTNVYRYEI